VLPASELEQLQHLGRAPAKRPVVHAVEPAVEPQELSRGQLLVDERAVGNETERRLGRLGSRARSWLLTRMRPEVGLRRPAIIRIVVVLPAPLGPRKPWISPGLTSRLTPSTAVKVPYFLTRFR
jgi:hypothetical protein